MMTPQSKTMMMLTWLPLGILIKKDPNTRQVESQSWKEMSKKKSSSQCLTPRTKRKAGRPALKRKKASDEPTNAQRRHKCKNCGNLGHQTRKCKEPIMDQHSFPDRGPQRTSNRGGDRRIGASSSTTRATTSEAPTTFSTATPPPIMTACGPMMDLLGQVSGGCLP